MEKTDQKQQAREALKNDLHDWIETRNNDPAMAQRLLVRHYQTIRALLCKPQPAQDFVSQKQPDLGNNDFCLSETGGKTAQAQEVEGLEDAIRICESLFDQTFDESSRAWKVLEAARLYAAQHATTQDTVTDADAAKALAAIEAFERGKHTASDIFMELHLATIKRCLRAALQHKPQSVEALKKKYPEGHKGSCICASCMKVFVYNQTLDDLAASGLIASTGADAGYALVPIEILRGISPLTDCDCPEDSDDESIGWQGGEEIPVTFGQIRAFNKLLSAPPIAERKGE